MPIAVDKTFHAAEKTLVIIPAIAEITAITPSPCSFHHAFIASITLPTVSLMLLNTPIIAGFTLSQFLIIKYAAAAIPAIIPMVGKNAVPIFAITRVCL
jgi:hypothetical protein